jgi:hypothetical protein
MESFPNGAHDDMVDMTTMHLLCRRQRVSYAYQPAKKPEHGFHSSKGVF